MQRRTVLVGVGTGIGAALAGCIGPREEPEATERNHSERRPDDRSSSPRSDIEPDPGSADGSQDAECPGRTADQVYDVDETITLEGGGTVRLESVRVQRSVIHFHVWRRVIEPDSGQMLVFQPRGSDFDIRFHAAFECEPIDSEWQGLSLGNGDNYFVSVPVQTVEQASIVSEDGREPAWRLPEPILDNLARAPEFSLLDASIGEDDGDTVLELTVENRGVRDGTFRAISVSSVVHDADAPIRFPVLAGETVTERIFDGYVEHWDPDAEFDHDVTPQTRSFYVPREDEHHS